MEDELIYWRHKTPVGVKVEEIFGDSARNSKVWLTLARQVYCENGKDRYREIAHFDNGAPYLVDEDFRISISHTDHMFVVASLPKTPEVNLRDFNARTAMGIDVEKFDRSQVMKIRDKFLSKEEQNLTRNDITANIIAWTMKEAMYKAAFQPGLEIKTDLIILSLPDYENSKLGRGIIKRNGQDIEMILYSYKSEEYLIGIALSTQCATFKKTCEK